MRVFFLWVQILPLTPKPLLVLLQLLTLANKFKNGLGDRPNTRRKSDFPSSQPITSPRRASLKTQFQVRKSEES